METRRNYLKKIFKFCMSVFILRNLNCRTEQKSSKVSMKSSRPQKALVIWYSQTGHTERVGKIIAFIWRQCGLQVDALNIHCAGKTNFNNYDLIAVGTPVFYGDVPVNVKKYLCSICRIDKTPVAVFVTYGGPGGYQHNTCCSLLENLSQKGGIPIGMQSFGNMSTFAPTWSMGNEKRILKYKHLPNEKTYDNIRKYASNMIKSVHAGKVITIDREVNIGDIIKGRPMFWFTKLLFGKHAIDKNKCIGCGTCVANCPSGSIQLAYHSIKNDKCILCLGCINNCPVQAIDMTFLGKKVYGFKMFLKRYNIIIKEPEEKQNL